MDIFTTQIAQATKSISTTVRPEKLKVKALAKEARLGKLKNGVHVLDDSEYDLYQADVIFDKENSTDQSQDEVVELSDKARELEQKNSSDIASETEKKIVISQKSETKTKKIEKKAHLDIFI